MDVPQKEYNTIRDLLKEGNRADAYDLLIRKEENVINMVNRLIDHDQKKDMFKTNLLNMTINDVFLNFAKTWKTIMNELISGKFMTFHKLMYVFLHDDRKIYVGIMLILLSLFLFFIDIST